MSPASDAARRPAVWLFLASCLLSVHVVYVHGDGSVQVGNSDSSSAFDSCSFPAADKKGSTLLQASAKGGRLLAAAASVAHGHTDGGEMGVKVATGTRRHEGGLHTNDSAAHSANTMPVANILALIESTLQKDWLRTHKTVVVVFSIVMIGLALLCMFSSKSPTHHDAPESGTVAAAQMAQHESPETTGSAQDDEDEVVVVDTMTYRTDGLATLSVFMSYPGTVWDNDTLWLMCRRLIGLAVVIATVELLFVPDPGGMDPSRFATVGTMLNVFVGLLLSFFLASSVQKWFQCVNGFLHIFDSVRNMQMQFHALGVRRERSDHCIRYGVVSAWLLNYELRQGWSPKAQQDEMKAAMWAELVSRDDYLSRVLPEERAILDACDDASGLIWTWVGSLVGRMAQDGDIPSMASPTYGRIIDLAQRAHDGLRQVRSAINVQMPFVYVHTLATIVQLNNILAAVSFGLTLGATMGSAVARINYRLGIYAEETLTPPTRPLLMDVQDALTQLFKCFVVPVLYQAFFEIGVAISSPFSSEDSAIPTERLLVQLRRDLHSANQLADGPPSWKTPCFTENMPPSAASSPTAKQ